MIPREVVDEIIRRNDIEDVVGSYVTLKRAGSNRNGLCPFHSEKTPSFTVFPATSSFYCFGCGAGGNVITFIQKIENLDYVGAVEFLGARVGVTVPHDTRPDERPLVPRKRIYEMNLEAAKFFRSCLFDPTVGREGLAYLTEKRALSGAVIKHFGLGFAPNDFTALTRRLREAGYTDTEMTVGFLAGRSQRSDTLYDLFRNRIMFPVIDTTGNIVAFGGRVMDDSKPKYLNSADTPGFKKSRVLFGLNYARHACAEEMIVCEGYMDTIAIQAAGFTNAVATLGTAITQDHARLLARYTKRVILNYDSDEAGQKAADKAMRLLDEVGLPVRVLKLTGAKDADEFIRKNGADAFRALLGKSDTAFDFKMEKALSRYDINTGDGKLRASRELVDMIAETPSSVARELYVKAAAERLGVSPESLANDVKRARTRYVREQREKDSREARLSAVGFGDRVNPEAVRNPDAATAESVVLGLLLLRDENREAVAAGRVPLTEEDFITAFDRRVFNTVMELQKSPDGFSFDLLGAVFSPDEMGRLTYLRQERQQMTENDETVLARYAAWLRDKHEQRAATDLQSEVARRREQLKKKKQNQ